MNTRTRMLALAMLVATIILAACGGQSAQPTVSILPTQASTNIQPTQAGSNVQPNLPTPDIQPTLPSAPNAENGGEGGVEAALVTYSDVAQGFAIGHPGPWTQDTSITAGVKFVGGDDYMSLEFVTPSAGTDAITYAQSDVAAVTAAFPGFKQIDLKASTEVKDAIILGFTADGKSAVTGKTFTAHNERYYMPLVDGRIAILTVVGPENHYDREGVRDIALTFKLIK
jgi:hypothetical protein